MNVDWFFLSHRLPLALAAKKSGYTVYVAAANTGRSETIETLGLHFIDIQELKSFGSIVQELNLILILKKLYVKLKPELIHHVTIRPVLYGSIAARQVKIPSVVNALSGLGYVYINNTKKNRVLRVFLDRLFKWGFNHPNSILILQNVDDKSMILSRNIIKDKKIKIIPGSGVDTNLIIPKDKTNGDVKVALIGRMLWDKGIREFVEAARICYRNELKATFHLYGAPYDSNPMSISNQQLSEWHDEGIVQIHGHIENIPDILNEIDIVCLPSYREGLPKSLIEAAAAGLPIITTDVPGCRDVVSDGVNGYLVPMKDIDLLAGRIHELVNDKSKRVIFGIAGRKIAVERFSVDLIVADTLDVYDSLLTK